MKTEMLSGEQQVELAVERAVSQEARTDAVDSVDKVMVREEHEQDDGRKRKRHKKGEQPKKRQQRKKRKPAKKR
jgi:hypothetical protein